MTSQERQRLANETVKGRGYPLKPSNLHFTQLIYIIIIYKHSTLLWYSPDLCPRANAKKTPIILKGHKKQKLEQAIQHFLLNTWTPLLKNIQKRLIYLSPVFLHQLHISWSLQHVKHLSMLSWIYSVNVLSVGQRIPKIYYQFGEEIYPQLIGKAFLFMTPIPG